MISHIGEKLFYGQEPVYLIPNTIIDTPVMAPGQIPSPCHYQIMTGVESRNNALHAGYVC